MHSCAQSDSLYAAIYACLNALPRLVFPESTCPRTPTLMFSTRGPFWLAILSVSKLELTMYVHYSTFVHYICSQVTARSSSCAPSERVD